MAFFILEWSLVLLLEFQQGFGAAPTPSQRLIGSEKTTSFAESVTKVKRDGTEVNALSLIEHEF
ncbi:hypothetical protein CH362_11170 [Leptospira saintgironsiae]|uniref:Uncharacterized protein n=1 Tax=Leptospira saintgironsiae TaxID=2023183 RepID=A0A2M9YC29_9LEPT|nr:hypothetical protein CH362_11170 [Leptospira saintgironsiae]